ncbi:hypothetical protein POX_c04010 [Penicillium oxalicum]|uniref:hypothetical protein n=1 Tax=Penicillium oxalicum TaxID=69781 RepID=UPI0020B8FD30|nr:hypothetical protein POX_c04010 [Penicillium oxalicum]KAI2791154.1 hypothetical protein POX_c04010 [Penicillium oxalicum]
MRISLLSYAAHSALNITTLEAIFIFFFLLLFLKLRSHHSFRISVAAETPSRLYTFLISRRFYSTWWFSAH